MNGNQGSHRFRAAFAVLLAPFSVVCCDAGGDPGVASQPSPPLEVEARSGLALVDVAAERGLRWRHDAGVSGRYLMFETMGGGVAWIDVEGDGDLDLFLPSGQPADAAGAFDRSGLNRLFRNDGDTFVDATASSGLGGSGYGLGAAVGDVDNDGDADLYLLRYGDNVLYRNRGDGTFVADLDAGVEGAAPFSASAAFADLDGDGWLDLYLCSYIRYDAANPQRCFEESTDGSGRVPIYCGPIAFEGAADQVFLNNRDGTFRDASARAGLVAPSASASKSLGVLAADFDRDADIDLYVACDTTANLLYLNRGDARFDERGLVAGVAASEDGAYEGGMGIAAGDVDGDGFLDLFVTNFSDEPNRLYRGAGEARFRDVTGRVGLGFLATKHVGWGTFLEDLDLDGDLDLFVANGHIYDNVSHWDASQAYEQPCAIYLAEGAPKDDALPRYRSVGDAMSGVLGSLASYRGVACGDPDNDGDLDVVVVALDRPPRLLENRSERRGRHFLTVELVGSGAGGRDAIGAVVEVALGERTLRRWRVGGGSYLSSNDPRLHFGLGDAARLDALRVDWPDGAKESFPAPPVDRFVRIVRGERLEVLPARGQK